MKTSDAAPALESVARDYVLHEPPYCLKFPESNCKTQRRNMGKRKKWCIKCRLREALGIEFAKHQPEGTWWL